MVKTDSIKLLPSPQTLKNLLPLKNPLFIHNSRDRAKNIFLKKEKKFVIIVGPCSIHDEQATLDFAQRLKILQTKVQTNIFLIMRFFAEKPRSTIGWKGFIYDPDLDSSYNIEKGLLLSRKLLIQLAQMHVPTACEFVDPLIAPYIEDLICWGFIGARTCASQPHRQMASSFPFPVGFKNFPDGNIDLAIDGAATALSSHNHLKINNEGRIGCYKTTGNNFTHLVLRGSYNNSNYHRKSLLQATDQIKQRGLNLPLLIDCSHGNCRKNFEKQKNSFKATIQNILSSNFSIIGLMCESNINSSTQPLTNPKELRYGVSITDPCLDWNTTEKLILWASSKLP